MEIDHGRYSDKVPGSRGRLVQIVNDHATARRLDAQLSHEIMPWFHVQLLRAIIACNALR